MRKRIVPQRGPIYTLNHLLEKQPKGFRKDPLYPGLINSYLGSPRLKAVRINRRCYKLLNNGTIKPEHLENFIRTYRLPADPFFPLFFQIKRSYLDRRAELGKKRREYIDSVIRSLPREVREFMDFLGDTERACNRTGRHPLWNTRIYPNTKKQAQAYEKNGFLEWILFFKDYLELLQDRYKLFKPDSGKSLLSCFILGCLPAGPAGKPDPEKVKREFRRLSKDYHPDNGGDPRVFIFIKWAKDQLS